MGTGSTGRWLMVALSVAAALALATSAVASHGGRASTGADSARDPDDADSRLDLIFVEFRGLGDGKATLTIRTAERWGCAT